MRCKVVSDDTLAKVNDEHEMLHDIRVLHQQSPCLAIYDDPEIIFFLTLDLSCNFVQIIPGQFACLFIKVNELNGLLVAFHDIFEDIDLQVAIGNHTDLYSTLRQVLDQSF